MKKSVAQIRKMIVTELARSGGHARAKALTRKERVAIGKMGARARWRKRKVA